MSLMFNIWDKQLDFRYVTVLYLQVQVNYVVMYGGRRYVSVEWGFLYLIEMYVKVWLQIIVTESIYE